MPIHKAKVTQKWYKGTAIMFGNDKSIKNFNAVENLWKGMTFEDSYKRNHENIQQLNRYCTEEFYPVV